MLSVKQEGIKFHFLSFWYDSTWDWTQVSRAIGEYSTHCPALKVIKKKDLLCYTLTFIKQRQSKKSAYSVSFFFFLSFFLSFQSIFFKTEKFREVSKVLPIEKASKITSESL